MSDSDLLFSDGKFNHSEGAGEFSDGCGWSSSGEDKEFATEAADYSMVIHAHIAKQQRRPSGWHSDTRQEAGTLLVDDGYGHVFGGGSSSRLSPLQGEQQPPDSDIQSCPDAWERGGRSHTATGVHLYTNPQSRRHGIPPIQAHHHNYRSQREDIIAAEPSTSLFHVHQLLANMNGLAGPAIGTQGR